jgi:hypothetical protein
VGQTNMGIQDYGDLKEYDIVFFDDDDANVRSGKSGVKQSNGMKFLENLKAII